MNQNEDLSGWQVAFLVLIGLICAIGASDLAGRIVYFAYGELKYLCAGFGVMTFYCAVWWVHSEFKRTNQKHLYEVNKAVDQCKSNAKNIKDEAWRMHDEIKLLRDLTKEHISLCSVTIHKIDKLMEQKTPIVVSEIKPMQEPIEPDVDDAVQEVTGGAL